MILESNKLTKNGFDDNDCKSVRRPSVGRFRSGRPTSNHHFLTIAGNLLKQLFITVGTDGKECPRVPKSGEDVVPEIERSVAAADDYRERTIPVPVSD